MCSTGWQGLRWDNVSKDRKSQPKNMLQLAGGMQCRRVELHTCLSGVLYFFDQMAVTTIFLLLVFVWLLFEVGYCLRWLLFEVGYCLR